MILKIAFVSDLHLFTRRSVAEHFIEKIRLAAESVDAFFLGGDIVDFKWSQFRTHDETINAAEKWIIDLIKDFTNCQFHYLLGNHDCHPDLIRRLEQIQINHDNFQWEAYFSRIGSAFFLHGDVVDTVDHSQEQLEKKRANRIHHKPRGRMAGTGYELLVAARLHRLASRFAHQPEKIASRLLKYLDNIGHGVESGIQQVFFGHTHAQLSDFVFEGVRFHNGGAPVKGLPFKLIQTEIQIDE